MCSATLSNLVFWGTGLGTWVLCEDLFSYKDEGGLFALLGGSWRSDDCIH